MKNPNWVNQAALQRTLREISLDALLAMYPKNTYYYSGSPVARAHLMLDYLPEDPGRPTLSSVVVRADLQNVLICPVEEEGVNRAEAWVTQIHTYEPYQQSPMAAVADVIRNLGLQDGRVGVETDYLTVHYQRELNALLPRARFVPSDERFEWIRSLKTEPEIQLMKQMGDLLDDAMWEAFSEARPGDTEWDVHCRIIDAALRRGADHCRGILQTGDAANLSFLGSGPRRLTAGDIVRTDYAAFYRGYPGHVSRVAVVGPPTHLQRKIYANLLAGHHRIIEYMRPGVTGQEVFRFGIKAYSDLGYLTTYRTILGHNLGLGYHERPMLTEAETMPLEATNVVALEPKTEVPYHLQDQVVITENGAYLQTDKFDTRDLFVIGA